MTIWLISLSAIECLILRVLYYLVLFSTRYILLMYSRMHGYLTLTSGLWAYEVVLWIDGILNIGKTEENNMQRSTAIHRAVEGSPSLPPLSPSLPPPLKTGARKEACGSRLMDRRGGKRSWTNQVLLCCLFCVPGVKRNALCGRSSVS